MRPRLPVQTDAAPGVIGPYSQAIVSGDLVFTAGQLGSDPATGRLVEGGTAAQAEQALRNLEAVLSAAGTDFSQVLKTTIFLADIADAPEVNEVYQRHVAPPYPARSTVAVKGLPRGALVEIECIAQVGERGEQ
jgi:2-iminobutanoate/2-iminopropanoate deaminase